ncbi:MAG: hypothetical protein PHO10_06735 [Gemmiger sp.]|nr:hypothetical protein [Gemmiger sp.]
MITKTWLVLSILAIFIQIFLAKKGLPWWSGLVLPFVFFCCGCYAWYDLSSIGIQMAVLVCAMIPPVILPTVYAIFYWKRRYENLRGASKNEK